MIFVVKASVEVNEQTSKRSSFKQLAAFVEVSENIKPNSFLTGAVSIPSFNPTYSPGNR